MARQSNEALWGQWRQREARYEQGAETAAAFCRREGVSMASLFSWRRRLKSNATRALNERPAASPERPQFLPVRIASAMSAGGAAVGNSVGSAAGERVEIELPGGAVVRLMGPSRRLLRATILAASDAASREASSC